MMAYSNFDGSTGRITVSGYRGVSGNHPRAVSVWLRTTQSGIGTICYWGDDFTAPEIEEGSQNRVRLLNGYLQLFGLGSFQETASQVNDGSWHHVAFNWTSTAVAIGHEDFSVADIYVDNVLDNGRSYERTGRALHGLSDQTIITPAEAEVVIGALPTGTGTNFVDFYDGDMDEFAIYNDFLSWGTLSGIYNTGTPGVDLKTVDPVHRLQLWYTMGDDGGDSAPGTMVDQVFMDPNGRNGTVSGGVTII
jgi:hypothetical protein